MNGEWFDEERCVVAARAAPKQTSHHVRERTILGIFSQIVNRVHCAHAHRERAACTRYSPCVSARAFERQLAGGNMPAPRNQASASWIASSSGPCVYPSSRFALSLLKMNVRQ